MSKPKSPDELFESLSLGEITADQYEDGVIKWESWDGGDDNEEEDEEDDKYDSYE